ncbi:MULTISPECIES: restriction endonuclease subunit S [Bacteroides]|uniref:restriction endonuclease subunit S n=1 Tax=Bacteroides TaxID=816 RepID=UPI00216409FB|nr:MULTISPECIES: restriction endonuclease subunit S [Bacteroides]MCS2677476.1 restriction endonuclease subunit S [Bacteroides ovatus]MCS3253447.1 restriction endonuclease subunit S [Bacteroides ovatus]MCZ2725342.1 restriction endonuclease subunit S [Bacteroides caccae]UVO71633.1 restriction endonuclease subunit S [Bacteroides ovatus]UVR45805.1 restriction endonuclease subunit S [Bacteroides ovatus]
MIRETKCLDVPHLRFPEFTEEWRSHFLTDFMSFKNGMNPDAKRFGRGTKFISVMDILNNQFICYDNIRASVEVMDGDIDTYGVNYGDILFQRSSETLEDVGQANVYLDSKPAIFGGFVIRGKSKGNYNPLFFRYLLASPTARKRIIVKGAGAQHFNIGQDGLSKVSLDIPCMQEQKKIGELLQCIDARIATQNKIIEKLQSLIKGLIDDIITLKCGQLVAFETLYSKAGEGGTPTTSNTEFYDNGSIPFIKIDDLSNKYLSANKDYITELGLKKSSAWLIPTHSIIYSNGATIGAISINKYPVCTKQGILGIVPNTNIDVEFLYYFMQSSYFQKEVERVVTEGTMKTAYLKDINHIKCPIPDLDRQKEISHLLSVLSLKEDVERQLLQKYQIQKQYLLRKMFI